METENNEDEMERVKVFFKALERRKMNGMSVRGRLWALQVEAVGKPSVYLYPDTAASTTSPATSAPGGNPFILPDWNTKVGQREGALSVCVYKEHTDGLLTFTVINNVVTQLEKKNRLKEEASLMQRGAEIRGATERLGGKQCIPCSREYLWVLLCTFSSYFIGWAVGFPHLLIS